MRIFLRILALPVVVVISAVWIVTFPVVLPIGAVIWALTGRGFESVALWGAVVTCTILDRCND